MPNQDFDQLANTLASDLGIETLTLVSAQREGRPMIGIEALAAYGTYLFGIFAYAVLEQVRARLEREAKEAGKKVADLLIDRVKQALAELRQSATTGAGKWRDSGREVDAALRELAAYKDAKAALREAERAGREGLVAQLKSDGMSDADAQQKADKLLKSIVSHLEAA